MKNYIEPKAEVKVLTPNEGLAALDLSGNSVPDNKDWGKIYD